MSADTAPELVRSYFDRWKRLEDEKAAISEDLKELFAEAKSEGFDTKAMRAAFRLQARERTAEDEEFDALVELYTEALNGPSRARVQARDAREAETPIPARASVPVPVSADARKSAPFPERPAFLDRRSHRTSPDDAAMAPAAE